LQLNEKSGFQYTAILTVNKPLQLITVRIHACILKPVIIKIKHLNRKQLNRTNQN